MICWGEWEIATCDNKLRFCHNPPTTTPKGLPSRETEEWWWNKKCQQSSGVGVSMLRGEGIPLIENDKFQSFLVSWFQSCKVSKIRKFNNGFMFWGTIAIPYYQISISCLLEDIDPKFKISRIFKTYVQAFSARVVFIFKNCRCS